MTLIEMNVGQNKDVPSLADGSTVADFIEFVCKAHSLTGSHVPTWPPDVFGIVAMVMRRNGAYVRSVASGFSGSQHARSLLDDDWPQEAKRVGEEWRAAIVRALKANLGPGRSSVSGALKLVAVPDEVKGAWDLLTQLAPTVRIERGREHDDLARALIQLSGYTDEACIGIGLSPNAEFRNEFDKVTTFLLEQNKQLSVCSAVDPQRARVLPKKHTPQSGLTLRSLSHHLSLCMPWEVEAQWFEFGANYFDVLNLLLLPWPLDVDAKHFRCLEDETSGNDPREHRTFEYSRPSADALAFKADLEGAIDRAKKCVSKLHAIVLPELALTRAEWDIAQGIAIKRGVLLISGILDDTMAGSDLPVNCCRIELTPLSQLRTGSDSLEPDPDAPMPPSYRQEKHHRWCLDRSQVLQYDLGGQLPSTKRCWENSHVGQRGIFFATLGGWLTFSVLICEDLARQDPIAEVMRSVGPNLVVALLMDGPQLAARWPARYASVLADDPGSSVLTLTSLGMCLRSRPTPAPAAPASRVVALWKDKLYGSREISLEKDKVGCVLSLSCEAREEFTADGRSDSGWTQVPVFSGVFQV